MKIISSEMRPVPTKHASEDRRLRRESLASAEGFEATGAKEAQGGRKSEDLRVVL
jgi:hypothetical protein